jgi:hypothetical protein
MVDLEFFNGDFVKQNTREKLLSQASRDNGCAGLFVKNKCC